MENYTTNERPSTDVVDMYLQLRGKLARAEGQLEKLTARLDRLENRKPRTKGKRGASPPNLSQQRKPKP